MDIRVNTFTETLGRLLRERTKADHHRLDHHPMLSPLVQPTLRHGQYERLLKTLYWIHLPLHSALKDGVRLHFPFTRYQPSDRIRWLQSDFDFLAIKDPRLDLVLGGLEFNFNSPAALVGALYTVEGSTLGGQVIARQLKASLGIETDTGARFFNGHGDATQARWAEFWRFANEANIGNLMEDACVSASGVFTMIGTALTRAESHWTSIDRLDRHSKVVPRVPKIYFSPPP